MTSAVAPSTPGAVYETRLVARRATLQALESRDALIANTRLATALTMIPLAWAAWGGPGITAWWMLAPLGVFVVLVVLHGQVLARIKSAAAAVRFYEQSLARLAGEPVGPEGTRFLDDEHPYSSDLDLFGPRSLFSLLCTAQTQAGEDALAHWLRAPADPDEVGARQHAARELTPNLDLREELAVLGSEVRAGVRHDTLVRWATAAHALPAGPWLPLSLLALAATVVAAAAAWGAGASGPLPFLLCVFAVIVVSRWLGRAVQGILGGVEEPSRELSVLARIMVRLVREPFASGKLVRLRSEMSADGLSAPRQVTRLGRLIELADARRNQLFAPFAFLLLWGPLSAWLLERWRRRCGPRVQGWLSSVGELEALASFAAYAFDHPDDVFPEVVAGGGPLLEAAGLTHPLLPQDKAVRNDLALGAPLRLVLVSGSNMSGKSTLLRSVGTSVAMALAGSPVRARAFRLSPLCIGASLRVRESLQQGSSRFYAEIRRLRQITGAAEGATPLLFLLDEILGGTNSHDRRHGAEAVLAALVTRGAAGLVTSHDLALTDLVPKLGERAANMHFVDHLEAGQLVFDYKLRPGIVQKSNAVELMRAIGLPV